MQVEGYLMSMWFLFDINFNAVFESSNGIN